MKFRNRKALLSLIIATVLGGVMVAEAVAQSPSERSEERRARKSRGEEGKATVLYPNATRQESGIKASAKLGTKLQKMIDVFNKGEYEQARSQADAIIATAGANEYDKALAAQIAAQSAYSMDDNAAAKQYLQQALQSEGLDNNGYYQSMFMLAQLHMMDDEYAQALPVINRFLEARSQKPEELIVKGNILYRMERYQEAIPVLKQAIASAPEPKNDWIQLLMASYAEADQPGEAVKLAEQLAAKTPNDKKAQMNLASVYLQADQMDKAAATLEKVRSSGQLSDEREYRQLYAAYLNMEGKEKEAISVINEGLQKQILKPDYQTYVALAQAYYFSDQNPQAIEAYQKAAPLASDGETYLNLAKVLWAEDRIPEAKQAAQQALAKGLKNPADARKIINLK
jgi:tetratricopeptide (TPR) repeat protein